MVLGRWVLMRPCTRIVVGKVPRHPLLTTAGRQELPVEAHLPLAIEALLLEGLVEGYTVAIALRLNERAIAIQKESAQRFLLSLAGRALLCCLHRQVMGFPNWLSLPNEQAKLDKPTLGLWRIVAKLRGIDVGGEAVFELIARLGTEFVFVPATARRAQSHASATCAPAPGGDEQGHESGSGSNSRGGARAGLAVLAKAKAAVHWGLRGLVTRFHAMSCPGTAASVTALRAGAVAVRGPLANQELLVRGLALLTTRLLLNHHGVEVAVHVLPGTALCLEMLL
mmetsp:Transcript_33926/g.73820  ORF Transcript_33926/g.73820 Transcript_33926/m.73820 type:complete len:282 (+) Transcript_33926:613-1458(+)